MDLYFRLPVPALDPEVQKLTDPTDPDLEHGRKFVLGFVCRFNGGRFKGVDLTG
jgi:hypothetical protein